MKKKAIPDFFNPITLTQIVYWDDDEKNVEGARGLGIQSNVYIDFPSFIKQIRKYFPL